MLSAAGKEIHMIEDASVALEMLSNVSISLRTEAEVLEVEPGEPTPLTVPVPDSDHITSLALHLFLRATARHGLRSE